MTSVSLRIVAMALLVVVLNQVVFASLRLFGVHVQFLLAVAIAVGISGGAQKGAERGAIAGFIGGLIADVFLPTPFGLSALAYAVGGYAAGYIARDASDLYFVSALLAATASIISVTVFIVIGSLADAMSATFLHSIQVVAVVGIFNMVVSPLLVSPLRKTWAELDSTW